MKKVILIFVLIIFMVSCADTLSVKEKDTFIAKAKLIKAEYTLHGRSSHYWVLTFDNNMEVVIDLRSEKYKPKYFEVEKYYRIYTDGTWMKVQKVREE